MTAAPPAPTEEERAAFEAHYVEVAALSQMLLASLQGVDVRVGSAAMIDALFRLGAAYPVSAPGIVEGCNQIVTRLALPVAHLQNAPSTETPQ